MLADHFVRMDAGDGRQRSFNNEALQTLMLYHWPGNVRELKNVVDRAKIIADGDVIGKDAIILDSAFISPPGLGPMPPMMPLAPPASSRYGDPAPMGGYGELPPRDPAYFDLNDRQRRLIDYLKAYGSIRNRDYYELMKVSKSTGWRDLKDLIKREIVQVHGKGKGSVYTLKEREG